MRNYRDEERVEQTMIALTIAVGVLLFLIPFVLWKAVGKEPGYYDNLTFKQVVRVSIIGFAIAGIISAALWLFPDFAHYTVWTIGHLKIPLKVPIGWLVANIALGSLVYLLIPIWRPLFRNKGHIKDQLY